MPLHTGQLLEKKLLLVWLTGFIEGMIFDLLVQCYSERFPAVRYGTYFGDQTAQVKLYNPDPDTWSIFAGSDNNKLTLVIINKKPDQALSFNLSNVPTGSYFMRHFGGAAGVAKWQVCDVWLLYFVSSADL